MALRLSSRLDHARRIRRRGSDDPLELSFFSSCSPDDVLRRLKLERRVLYVEVVGQARAEVVAAGHLTTIKVVSMPQSLAVSGLPRSRPLR